MDQKTRCHIFVCVNERDVEHPKGCCAARGGREIVMLLKQLVKDRGLKDVKITKSGCLGPCLRGANLVIYPEGIWHYGVTPDKAQAILEDTLALR